MKRYLNGFRADNVVFGDNSGQALTTGMDNVLLGKNAGSSITTGANNVILGGFTADTNTNKNIVLSNGEGTVACRWDEYGNVIQTIKSTKTAFTLSNDNMTITYDSTNKTVNFTVKSGGRETVSRTILSSN